MGAGVSVLLVELMVLLDVVELMDVELVVIGTWIAVETA